MKTLFKIVFGLALVGGGGYYYVNNSPSLKANILEVVNPQIKVEHLAQQLDANLAQIGSMVATPGTTIPKKLIAQSQALVAQIHDISTAHPGVVQQAVTQVASQITGAIFGTSIPSPTPLPTSASTSVVHPSTSTVPCAAI